MLPLLRADDPPDSFPPVETALEEPNGLLAAGGDLSPARLLAAYYRGIFPWYSQGDPILWWSPDPRTVFKVGQVHVPRRLARKLRQGRFTVTFNQAFDAVIRACAAARDEDGGTWLLPEMQQAYIALHKAGHAESVEVWDDQHLVGGLYGIPAGRVFCAESMFSLVSDASKIALTHLDRRLVEKGFALIDAQVGSAHLYRMGAVDLPRSELVTRIAEQR